MKPDTVHMWRVVYIAHTQQSADAVEQVLQQEGFLVDKRAMSVSGNTGVFELLVLKSEAEEARIVLNERGL